MTSRATAQSVTRELVSRVELGASVEPEWTVGPIDRGIRRPRIAAPLYSERRQDPGEGEMPVAWSVAVEGGRVTCPAPCTLTGDGSGGQSFPLCHH